MRHGNGSSSLLRGGIACLAVLAGAAGLTATPPDTTTVVISAEPDPESELCQLRRKLGKPCDLSNTAPMEEYYLAVEEAYLQANFDALTFDERADLITQILVVQDSQSPMPERVDADAYEHFMRLLDTMLLELEA